MRAFLQEALDLAVIFPWGGVKTSEYWASVSRNAYEVTLADGTCPDLGGRDECCVKPVYIELGVTGAVCGV